MRIWEILNLHQKVLKVFPIYPLNEGKVCYGIDLRLLKDVPKFTLKYFIDFYNKYENKEEFLTREKWFNTLAGTDELIKLIRLGKSEVRDFLKVLNRIWKNIKS